MTDDAKITLTDVNKSLQELALQVASLITSVTVKDQHRTLKDEEYERRLQNHGDRIRGLEAKAASRDDHEDEIKELRESVDDLKKAVNQQSWLPVLVTGILVSAIASIVGAVVINSLGG